MLVKHKRKKIIEAIEANEISPIVDSILEELIKEQQPHTLGKLIDLDINKELRDSKKRLTSRCSHCGSRTGFFCIQCSDVTSNKLICFCSNKPSCNAFVQHNTQSDSAIDETDLQPHSSAKLIDLEVYQDIRETNKRARRRCKYCGERTSFYCVQCSDAENNDLVCFCVTNPSCNAFVEHNLRQTSNRDRINVEAHTTGKLIDLEIYQDIRGTNKRARRRCKHCGGKTSFYCIQCSDIKNNHFICFCVTNPSCNAFVEHNLTSYISIAPSKSSESSLSLDIIKV
jgi:ribosomal protein S14